MDAPAQGINAQRRAHARRARRLVLEHPVVYYADVDAELRGQLALGRPSPRTWSGSPACRWSGAPRASRWSTPASGSPTSRSPATGTVAQAALLLCARIAGYLQRITAPGSSSCPRATAAERLAEAARRIDAALPDRGRVADLLADRPAHRPRRARPAAPARRRRGPSSGSAEQDDGDRARPPIRSSAEAWLRTELRKLVDEFGAGMAEKQVADPVGLLTEALGLLAVDRPGRAGGRRRARAAAARPLPRRHRPDCKDASRRVQ